jgi:hypothetical protein
MTTIKNYSAIEEDDELYGGGKKTLELMLALDDKNFAKLLKEFCHFYQIPFIENNVRKTAYNAAKIFYKLEEDNIKFADKFSWIVEHLSSIPKEEVEDTETTYSMKDKWMKFFKPGKQKMEIDQDAAMCFPQISYIEEFYRDGLTDKNLIRAFEFLEPESNGTVIKLADSLFSEIVKRIDKKEFDTSDMRNVASLMNTFRDKFRYFQHRKGFREGLNQFYCDKIFLSLGFRASLFPPNTLKKYFTIIKDAFVPEIHQNYEDMTLNEKLCCLVALDMMQCSDREL